MKKRICKRVLCALLVAVLLFTLAGCSGATLYASPRANRIVATAGNVEVAYEEL